VEALLRAAPGLRACCAEGIADEPANARALLRNEPPFGALRLHRLRVLCGLHFAGAAFLALAADLAASTFIEELVLMEAELHTPFIVNALMDAALTRRVQLLQLDHCSLSPALAPALARLLGGGALVELEIHVARGEPLLDAPAAVVLANALRACGTLTALMLRGVNLWRGHGAAVALLGALTGHASLRILDLSENPINEVDQAATGAALGTLVAANAPALTDLDVSWCRLGDAGLRPLFDALPANTHLTELTCSGNALTDACVFDTLLPAVRANGSLRQLRCSHQMDNASAVGERVLAEAEALVAQRAAGR
jgi:hypothetical protein